MDLDRILPKSTLLQAHLNAWFRFVHPCQGSGFLHRGILLRDVREGTASKKLVMAVCATAGRFFNGASTAMGLDPTKPLKPESWTYHAKNMVLMDEEVSLDNVATCLVLSRHFTHCGRLSLADSLAATATRQAAMIGLLDPATYSSLSWVEQEYRRRLAWACFCFERLAPIGNTVLTHVPRDPVKLQLPTEDHTYQLSIPTETPSADFEGRIVGEGSLNNVGMMGQLVVLLGMQDEASRVLHRLRSSSEQSCQPWNPLSPHAMILTRLQQWRCSLPSFLELTADNAYARSLQGEETPLALLHARFYSIMWGLYRVALPGFPESASAALMDLAPQSWIDETRTACMEQARAFGRVLALYDQHLPSHVLTDPSLPLMVFEVIRIQAAYTLLQPQSEGQKETIVIEAEALCKHVLRSERFFWHSGFMIKAISDFLGRQSMSTTLDPAAAGPAANTAVPVWMRDALLLPSDDSQQTAPDVNVLQTPVNSVIMPAGTSTQGAFTGGFVWDSMTSAGFSVTNPYCNMTGLATGGGDIMLDAGHIDLVDALFPEVNFGTQFDFGGQTGNWQLQ